MNRERLLECTMVVPPRYTVIALLVIYLFLHRLMRYFGTRNIIDEYVCMVMEWIRDAFRD